MLKNIIIQNVYEDLKYENCGVERDTLASLIETATNIAFQHLDENETKMINEELVSDYIYEKDFEVLDA